LITVAPAPRFTVHLAPVTSGNTTAGLPFNVTITALINGKPDTGYVGSVRITSSDPQVSPGTYSFLPGDDGSKILPITLETPGKQTVTVADASLPSLKGTSNAVVVTGILPTNIDHFTLTGFPSTDVTDSAHTLTITAVSAAGKTIAKYTGTVHVTSSDAAFTPFDVQFVASSKGVVKTPVTLTALGSQSLIVTDGSGHSGTEANIVVVSPATHLGITESATKVMAGVAVTVTVTGLTATTQSDLHFNDTLVLTTSDPHAHVAELPIPGGQTFTVTFTTAGTQTIAVTDITRPAIRGSVPNVSVSAAAVAQLSVTGFPLFAVAGLPQHFTVAAEDTYGNPVLNGFTDTIRVDGVNYPFKSSYHGTHLLTTTMATPGVYPLTASDITNPLVPSGTEGNITVVSSATAMITDPTNNTESALVVIAPAGGGTVVITPSDPTGTTVAVSINGKAVKGGPFAPTGHIIVYGQSGNDVVKEVPATINGLPVKVAIPALVLGGTGTNTLSVAGSSANNVLVGGSGKDNLTAGSGDDILIGGSGADVLKAGAGSDVLIGGSTIYDDNVPALLALMAEWGQSSVSLESRVQELFGNGSGGFLLNSQTVLSDSSINQLAGGTGSDWFWLSLNAKAADRISGFVDGSADTFE
jgi:Ca2+-binding RTX toxin-like protein